MVRRGTPATDPPDSESGGKVVTGFALRILGRRVAKVEYTGYDRSMRLIRIRFPDRHSERRALGFMAGRFSFTAYDTGEVLVVESALAALAVEGISFTSEGPASYAETIPAFRTPPAHQVQ
jgi:hypothetical protein